MKLPEGWPTDEMQVAGADAVRIETTPLNKIFTANRVFKAMLEAAPTPPAQTGIAQVLPLPEQPETTLTTTTPPAQEAEPVGYISQFSLDLLAGNECNVDIDVWTRRDEVSPHALYTAPQSDELRQAAEEALTIIEEINSVSSSYFTESAIINLRAALEGKS
jgi:hypothetical protein